MAYGAKKRQSPSNDNSISSYDCTYFKVRTENPSTEETMPSFVPVVKSDDGKYTEDWTEASEEVVGVIMGVEPRTYEYTRKGKTRSGFELRVYVAFGDNKFARLDFGKSGMLNALMNAIGNGLIGKPVRLFLWTSDQGYANISIKEYEENIPVGDMKRAEMSMTFRDFYDQYGKDSESLMKFAESAIIPLQEATFNLDDPFGVKVVSEAAQESMADETPQSQDDDLPF
jgi:hypothetical protein